MNSTKKGDDLETKVFNLFNEEISQDRFFVRKENCRIYSKKGYHSKDREKDIIFDISIEAFLPGQGTYSLLILIECKNYNHSVPVDDAEEFFSKIQQISGANIKGVLVATNSFQDGALKFAKSKGLGLLRYYDSSRFKWILTRSASELVSSSYAINEWMNAYRGVTIESFQSKYFDFYCYTDGEFTNSLSMFFLRLSSDRIEKELQKSLAKITNKNNENCRLVEYREASEIESISESVLEKISYESGDVPIHCICDWLSEETGLQIKYRTSRRSDSSEEGVLGKIIFDPLEINVFSGTENNYEREKFTLAHELGHYFLDHSRYMSGEYCLQKDFDFENPTDLGVKDIMRMEWQANHFASCLLLPKRQFIADFYYLVAELDLTNRGFGVLYLDDQKCNLDNFYRITATLKNKYKVSRSVVKIRLKKFGLLNESSVGRK